MFLSPVFFSPSSVSLVIFLAATFLISLCCWSGAVTTPIGFLSLHLLLLSYLPKYYSTSNSVPTCWTSSCATHPTRRVSYWEHSPSPSQLYLLSPSTGTGRAAGQGNGAEHWELWRGQCRRCLVGAARARAIKYGSLLCTHTGSCGCFP